MAGHQTQRSVHLCQQLSRTARDPARCPGNQDHVQTLSTTGATVLRRPLPFLFIRVHSWPVKKFGAFGILFASRSITYKIDPVFQPPSCAKLKSERLPARPQQPGGPTRCRSAVFVSHPRGRLPRIASLGRGRKRLTVLAGRTRATAGTRHRLEIPPPHLAESRRPPHTSTIRSQQPSPPAGVTIKIPRK